MLTKRSSMKEKLKNKSMKLGHIPKSQGPHSSMIMGYITKLSGTKQKR